MVNVVPEVQYSLGFVFRVGRADWCIQTVDKSSSAVQPVCVMCIHRIIQILAPLN